MSKLFRVVRQDGSPVAMSTTADKRKAEGWVRNLSGSKFGISYHLQSMNEGWRDIELPNEEITLPMPGDAWGAARVIASCWGNDDPKYGDITYTLLLLDPQPPYYAVITYNGTEYGMETNERYPNIIPAAEAYREATGGY